MKNLLLHPIGGRVTGMGLLMTGLILVVSRHDSWIGTTVMVAGGILILVSLVVQLSS